MKTYSNIISLTQNARGIYSLDPVMGCKSGLIYDKNGCYSDCYSAKSARLYGYDFATVVKRDFVNKRHFEQIVKEINSFNMPFIRMGSSGDPSEDWEHTFKIVQRLQKGLRQNQIDIFGQVKKEKQIVIITKHWSSIPDHFLNQLYELNVCINTSISAIDDRQELEHRINQYELLKNYCKSILRIVSFDFNLENEQGRKYNLIQNNLFEKYTMLDTVFRSSKSNPLVKNEIIKVHKTKFLGKNALISKRNKKTYFGKCGTCLEMCGVNM